MPDWLRRLSVGDKVVVRMREGRRLSVVKRATDKYVVCGYARFSRQDGREIDTRNDPRILEEPTSATIDEIRISEDRERILKLLYSFDWSDLCTGTLRRVEELTK